MDPCTQSRRERSGIVLLALVAVLANGSLTFGQTGASITGVVKDSSGAVLPGVTVEATSPALIEKVRSVSTDATGQYRVEALRPGTYTVTFTLASFTTLKRGGIELTGSFVATVYADLKLGSIEETVTVTSQSPLVDVQSTRQQRVFDKEVLDAIPQGRTPVTAAILVPGVTVSTFGSIQDVGGAANITLTGGQLAIHGSNTDDHRQMIDGVSTANADGGGAYASGFTVNMGAAQEVTLDYSSGSAEQSTGGTYLNIVPREGGNALKGSIFGSAVNGSFQGSNYTQELKDRGLRTPDAIKLAYDYNGGVGGAIKRDRLWFYTSTRFLKNSNYIAGIFVNENAGNPNAWSYDPDLSTPDSTDQVSRSVNLRLTVQATPRNKLVAFHDHQYLCRCALVTFNRPDESALRITYPVEDMTTVTWTAPVTSKLLWEARMGLRREFFLQPPRPPEGDPLLQMIDVTEQGGLIPTLLYRSQGVYRSNNGVNWSSSASVSYISRGHALKAGFTEFYLDKTETFSDNNAHVGYRFLNGVPNLITQRATPYAYHVKQPADFGLYAQDRWTVDRLTLNLGVRYDYYLSSFPAQVLGPGLLVPTRNISFPETPLTNFKDIAPRLGASYDLFGSGRTALKVSVNKYMKAIGIQNGFNNGLIDPVNGLANTVTRSWNPKGTPATNPNYYIPQCDLTNVLANGDCGTVSDTNFGKPTLSTTSDLSTKTGWGNRPYQWEFSTSVQQELTRRVSVNVGYFRRWLGNFNVVDNLALTPSDFDPFSVTAPLDPRLPGGGGQVIGPLYDRNPAKVSIPPINVVELASNYGTQIEHWNGVDASMSARLIGGLTLQGGMSTGRTSTDRCDILAKVPEAALLLAPYCHQDTNFLTQVKFLGTYTLPRVDVQFSGTFQSIPGPLISANTVFTNAVVKPSLGRDLAAGAANVTINLVPPGTLYGDRMNLLDFRFGKVLKVNRTRTLVSLNLYNVLNSSAVAGENATYVNATATGWRVPTIIAPARFARVEVQFDF